MNGKIEGLREVSWNFDVYLFTHTEGGYSVGVFPLEM